MSVISPLAYSGLTDPQASTVTDGHGWVNVAETWSLIGSGVSAFNEYTVSVTAGAAERYYHGEKVRFKVDEDATDADKYGYITGISDTYMYIRGDDAFLDTWRPAGAHLSNIGVSHSVSPLGFPPYFTFTPKITCTGNDPTFSTNEGTFLLNGAELEYSEIVIINTIGDATWIFNPPIPDIWSLGLPYIHGSGIYFDATTQWQIVTENATALVHDPANFATGVLPIAGGLAPHPPTLSNGDAIALTFNVIIDTSRTVT